MFRTDLAVEAAAVGENLPDGVTMEQYTRGGIDLCKVTVQTPEAAREMGKPVGVYITLDTPSFISSLEDGEEEIQAIVAELSGLLPGDGPVLVVGLGNLQITPDALGPRCAGQIVATRHFTETIRRTAGVEGIRPVAAMAPGVLGQTGMETGEIVEALTKAARPAAVIAVDAMAARSGARLGCTVQISDTGIVPGSGVQGCRKALCRDSLGVPVISVGVPTVVDAVTFVEDYLEAAGLPRPKANLQDKPDGAQGSPMIVTPHQVDTIVARAAKALALAINMALQPDISLEDLQFLMSE